MNDILCVGGAYPDSITLRSSISLRSGAGMIDARPGNGCGTALAAALAFAAAGARTSFCGTVGDDAAGALVLTVLEEVGVDTSRVRIVPQASSLRHVVEIGSAAQRRTASDVALAPTADQVELDGADWVFADELGYGPVVAAVTRSARPIPVSFGPEAPVRALDASPLSIFLPSVEAFEGHAPASAGESLTTIRGPLPTAGIDPLGHVIVDARVVGVLVDPSPIARATFRAEATMGMIRTGRWPAAVESAIERTNLLALGRDALDIGARSEALVA